METNFTSENRLKLRCVKDYNLPINVFREDLFNYYMNLYDFFPKDTFEKLKDKIQVLYNGNVEMWLDDCAKVRDKAIFGIMYSDAYQKFNNGSLDIFKVKQPCPTQNCYTQVTDGKRFISIDLRKGNFQALKYVGVLENNTYEDFIKRNGGDDYIANSKYLRQVIFGKLNPSRQIAVEKYLINTVYTLINEYMEEKGLKLFSFNNDELIYEVPIDYFSLSMFKDVKEYIETITKDNRIDVKVEYIKVTRLPIVSSNGTTIEAYERHNLENGESVLKKASTTFFPQIYKLWKNLPIEDNDLYFFAENQLAKFVEPLRMEL